MKTVERDHARLLRREQGLSVKEIARLLGVSPSSVSTWVRDIDLTDEQRQALRVRNRLFDRQMSATAAMVARRRARRDEYQEHGRALARRGESLHVAGCMLYWAEGAKNRNQVCFSNSDPDMVKLFLRFLRSYFAVADEDVRLTCHLFADHEDRQREVEAFWLDSLQLPPTSLRKSIVNAYSNHSSRKRLNKLPYGTCRLVVNDTRVMQSIWGSIQEYGAFRRDEWLG